ncbi:MAG TPA: hypothetical protein VFU94_15180 [Conexibacter sp.]|nr:hypothetical protein [Conexibacter sp.]
MTHRARTLGLLALVAAALLALPAGAARANPAYDRVAAAYNQGGAHLNPCAFTTAELESALRGIPPAFRTTVPALRRAIQGAIVARKRGECKGVKPEEGTTGGAAPGTVPPVTTTPSTPATAPPATTPTTATAPATTTPAPATTAPAPAQPAAAGSSQNDRTPLIVALIALGALLLAALALWGLAQTRGWDPPWVARMRHAWGEAGFRTTSTWTEFTDWLRLGR